MNSKKDSGRLQRDDGAAFEQVLAMFSGGAFAGNELALEKSIEVTAGELLAVNVYARQVRAYTLTPEQAKEIAIERAACQKSNRLVEFSSSATRRLLQEFCDASISDEYPAFIIKAQEIFYYFRALMYTDDEYDDFGNIVKRGHSLISDDELIQFMRRAYDYVKELEIVAERELPELEKFLKNGNKYVAEVYLHEKYTKPLYRTPHFDGTDEGEL